MMTSHNLFWPSEARLAVSFSLMFEAGGQPTSGAVTLPSNFLKVAVVQRLVIDDRVISHLRFTGHFTGTFMGHAGAGQQVDFIATDILRVRDGRITDNWHLEDNLTFLQQIGMVTSR